MQGGELQPACLRLKYCTLWPRLQMPAPTRKKKRSSSKPKPRKISPKKVRSKSGKRAPKAPAKRKRKRAAPKRSAASAKRSAASKKGWRKRRAKAKLLEKMADLKMSRDERQQPLGWIIRREKLRMHNDKMWRQISVTYDQSIVDKRRLETLKELEIDLLNQGELYDYLRWAGDLEEIEISDMYRMYLGYPLQNSLSESATE